MADYRKMYYVLCKAIDGITDAARCYTTVIPVALPAGAGTARHGMIDPLKHIPLAATYAQRLQRALLEAEEIYISTTPYAEKTEDPKIIQIKTDE